MKYKKQAQLILFLVGVFLLWWTLQSAGGMACFRITGSALKGWGFLVLFFYPFLAIWDVWGWKAVFSPQWRSKLKFRELFMIRLAGEALNNVTPFLDIGGEFLKVALVSKRFGIDKRTSVASVVVERSALFFSEVFFWIVGLVMILILLPVPGNWQWFFLGTVGIFTILSFILFWVQKKGFFISAVQWPGLQKFQVSFQDIDTQIAEFYSAKDSRLFVTLVLHFIGWVAGGVETWMMFHLAGVPVTLAQAMILESLLQLVRSASFFIPGNLGAQEAGLALFVQWMGYSAPLGVVVSLLKRLRMIIWSTIGFMVWGFYEWCSRIRS